MTAIVCFFLSLSRLPEVLTPQAQPKHIHTFVSFVFGVACQSIQVYTCSVPDTSTLVEPQRVTLQYWPVPNG